MQLDVDFEHLQFGNREREKLSLRGAVRSGRIDCCLIHVRRRGDMVSGWHLGGMHSREFHSTNATCRHNTPQKSPSTVTS